MKGRYTFGQVVTHNPAKLRHPYMVVEMASPYSARKCRITVTPADYDALMAGMDDPGLRFSGYNVGYPPVDYKWESETLEAIAEDTALWHHFRERLIDAEYHPETW